MSQSLSVFGLIFVEFQESLLESFGCSRDFQVVLALDLMYPCCCSVFGSFHLCAIFFLGFCDFVSDFFCSSRGSRVEKFDAYVHVFDVFVDSPSQV
jgi:hypothetical protein